MAITLEEAIAEKDRRARERAAASGVPEGLRAPTTLEQERQAAAPKPKPDISTEETVARGAMQGASLGFADEASAAVEHGIAQIPGVRNASAWLSEKMGDSPERVARQKNPDVPYSERRDQNRARDKDAAEASPVVSGLSNLGGAIATAPAMGAARGVAAIKQGIKLGAAQGLGSSEADLTRGDVAGAAKDVATGGVVGGAFAGGAEGVKAGLKYAGTGVRSALTKRIVNEASQEGATPTMVKKLSHAGNALADEAITGPDAKVVRLAWQGDPEKGKAAIQPILKKLGSSNEAAYKAFEESGRGGVDLGKFSAALTTAEKEAWEGGKANLSKSIATYRDHVMDEAQKFGTPGVSRLTIPLTQLRGLTSGAQELAAAQLGALDPGVKRRALTQVSAIAKEVMSDSLDDAAAGNPALTKMASVIRDNNRRIYALATADELLDARIAKAKPTNMMKAIAGSAASASTGGAVGFVTGEGDMEDKLKNMAAGAAVGATLKSGIPAAAKAVNRARTTTMINAANGALDAGAKYTQTAARNAAVKIATEPGASKDALYDAIFGDDK